MSLLDWFLSLKHSVARPLNLVTLMGPYVVAIEITKNETLTGTRLCRGLLLSTRVSLRTSEVEDLNTFLRLQRVC